MYGRPPIGGRVPPGAHPPGAHAAESPMYMAQQQLMMGGTPAEDLAQQLQRADIQQRIAEGMHRQAALQAAQQGSAWQQQRQQDAFLPQQQMMNAAAQGNAAAEAALYDGSNMAAAAAAASVHHHQLMGGGRKIDPPAAGDDVKSEQFAVQQQRTPPQHMMDILAYAADVKTQEDARQQQQQQQEANRMTTRRGSADPEARNESDRKMRPRKRKAEEPVVTGRKLRGRQTPAGGKGKPGSTPAPTKKRKKSKKSPNQPKNPLGAFVFFQKYKMPTVFEQNPCIAFGEAAATCGRLWKELSEDEKKPYTDMAKKDKERYIRELAEFRVTMTEKDTLNLPPSVAAKAASMKTRKPKSNGSGTPKNEPKKPRNPFIFYKAETITDIFKEFPLITFGEAATECAARFKLISPEEKQMYKEMAEEDKERYTREVEELKQKQASDASAAASATAEDKTHSTSEKPDDVTTTTADSESGAPEAAYLAYLPKYSEYLDPNDHYIEEEAWRYHNPPLPQSPVRKKSEKEPGGMKIIPPDSFVAPEDLRPPPPAPPLPETFPETGYCRWSFDEDRRVLYADFRREDGVVVTVEDEEFLLKMFERDDFTVVSEGLVSGLDKDKWTLDYISRVAGDDYFHKIRRFDRETPAAVPDSTKKLVRKAKVAPKKEGTGEAGKTGVNEDGDSEPVEDRFVDVRHVEIDRCLSMKVSDYVDYLKRRSAALEASQETEMFTFCDHLGAEHSIDVIQSVLYMIDYDMVKLLPTLYADFSACWKIPGILPGGTHCMMNSINVNGRPFMGPNVYITPPASFTHFHQDGHGTVDSGHFCVSGYNEVIMLRRLTERHKRHALRLLTDGDQVGSRQTFEALYNLPHGDGLGEKPTWPRFSAIDKCKAMNYYPSVFVLKPGQHCHISKGRLHAFRKLAKRPLPPDDCHSKLRAEVVGSSSPKENLCVSVAWDWMYRGVTSQGINREIVTSLECAALNRRYGVQSLAIPELSLLQMARTLVPEENEPQSRGEGKGSLIAFQDVSKATDASRGYRPSPEVVCKGIFPALQYVIRQQMDSIKSAESKESKSNQRCKRVSIAKRPNSWENPLTTTVDPYGESDFFCKLCHKELSNSYYHCDGCELILSKDFNICIECHTEKKYMIQVDMHPLNSKRHSTINHIGNMNYDRASRCPCKNGPICRHCNYCAGCSCRCHTWFTLSSRFLDKHGLLQVLSRARAHVGFAELEAADEVQKRLSMAVNGFLEDSDRVVVETDEVGEEYPELFVPGVLGGSNKDVVVAETKASTPGAASSKTAAAAVVRNIRSGTWIRDERQKLYHALETCDSWDELDASVPSRPSDQIRKFAESTYPDLVSAFKQRVGKPETVVEQQNEQSGPRPTVLPAGFVDGKKIEDVEVKDLQVKITFSKPPQGEDMGPPTRKSQCRETTKPMHDAVSNDGPRRRSPRGANANDPKAPNEATTIGRFVGASEGTVGMLDPPPSLKTEAVDDNAVAGHFDDPVKADAAEDAKTELSEVKEASAKEVDHPMEADAVAVAKDVQSIIKAAEEAMDGQSTDNAPAKDVGIPMEIDASGGAKDGHSAVNTPAKDADNGEEKKVDRDGPSAVSSEDVGTSGKMQPTRDVDEDKLIENDGPPVTTRSEDPSNDSIEERLTATKADLSVSLLAQEKVSGKAEEPEKGAAEPKKSFSSEALAPEAPPQEAQKGGHPEGPSHARPRRTRSISSAPQEEKESKVKQETEGIINTRSRRRRSSSSSARSSEGLNAAQEDASPSSRRRTRLHFLLKEG